MTDSDEHFHVYCQNMIENYQALTDFEVLGIKLLLSLRKHHAPLVAYEAAMEWHLRSTNRLLPRQNIAEFPSYVSRKTLLARLKKRYDYTNIMNPSTTPVYLPHAKTIVDVVHHSPEGMLMSLLTDPSVKDEDYWLDLYNPFAGPPDNLPYIADLQTGRSYLETRKALITKPNQILLPIIWYLDGASTGHFMDLPISALKFTLGIFTRKARDRPGLWRTLGFVPEFRPQECVGNKICAESGHLDTIQDEESEEEVMDDEGFNCVVQDYHVVLDKIFEFFLPLQDSGFTWDLRLAGQVHHVEFVIYTAFIRCDSKEADILCGRYGSYSKVNMLCHKCLCPFDETDNEKSDFPPKTPEMIQDLMDAEDFDQLKEYSQHYLRNAYYRIRFGLHNDHGVHGATPMEILHFILLGIFKYAADQFYEQVGPSSKTMKNFVGLARKYGGYLSRQSDRNLPKTTFGNLLTGKKTAKEFRGVLLVLAAVIRSTIGRSVLMAAVSNKKGKKFEGTYKLDDWVMLLETLLQWERWLCSDRISKRHIKKAIKKLQYLMYLCKAIGPRDKGMGWKLLKFHGILHLCQDMLDFGVPMEVDTGSCESGHKPYKEAARATQKRGKTFDKQTSERTGDFHVIYLAGCELEHRPLWNYFQGHYHPPPPPVQADRVVTCGAGLYVGRDEETGRNICGWCKPLGREPPKISPQVVDWLVRLQDIVEKDVGPLKIRTEHKRNGQVFRAHPDYMSGRWYDWVIVNWGNDYGKIPCHISCFLDLHNLPHRNPHHFGGVSLEQAVYAMVEYAPYEQVPNNEPSKSDIFLPIRKQMFDVVRKKRRFYLANTEAFHSPVAVIPDIGGPCNRYFVVENMGKWSESFEKWLTSPHKHDERFDFSDEDDDDDEENEEDDEANGQEPHAAGQAGGGGAMFGYL